jgi:hypothetical protein
MDMSYTQCADDKNSDQALIELLHQLRAAVDRTEVASLSRQIERLVFHRQMDGI